VAVSAGCICSGFFHRPSCATVAAPLRRYAEVEFAAWENYARATAGPRSGYARALKTRKRLFNDEFKRTKAGLGGNMSLYQMVMRMDELMGPPMEAYKAAVEPERRAWAGAAKAALAAYQVAVEEARTAFLEALVNRDWGVEPDAEKQRFAGGDLSRVAPVPGWLPQRVPPKDRPQSRETDQRLLMVWVPAVIAILTALTGLYFLAQGPTSPDMWAGAGLFWGASVSIGWLGPRPSQAHLLGPTIMAGGGIASLLGGGMVQFAAICLGGALALGGVEVGLARLMRGFPTRRKGPHK
jgi:hypothetical protein